MKWRRLLCIALCLAELPGCTAGSTTDSPALTATAGTHRDSSSGTASTASSASAASTASTAWGHSSSTTPTPAGATAGPAATSAASPGQPRTSPGPTSLPGSSAGPHGSPGVPTTPSPPGQPRDSEDASGSPVAGTGSAVAGTGSAVTRPGSAATPEHPRVPAATTAPHAAGDGPEGPLPAIGCHRARDHGDTGVCLQLNGSDSCEHFLERKGLDLWRAICENRTQSMASPCEIKLTPSSLDRDCLLLILKGEKDPDKLLTTLQKSHWEKFGIESLKKESARSPRDPSQKTLIALVTSGLLLASLGLAGYLLMRRRSWSPAGQRLAEDPYYTESQGNTLLMTPSQEPAELQEKPNLPRLNGDTQEKGPGPAGPQNGHSGRQHSPADTGM